MKKFTLKIKLLSDVIVNATAATEGGGKTLDFIPGSALLGVVAEHYNTFQNPYNIFHNQKVLFGDAHIANNNTRSLKAPLSWYYNKGNSIKDKIWVHHAITNNIFTNLVNNNIQLKQARTNWLVFNSQQDANELSIDTNFAIKSAYDRKTRRSKEGQLFGLKSLNAGSEWIFNLLVDENIEEKPIIEKLVGKKHIGKSKSSQYGKVFIEQIKTPTTDFNSTNLITLNNKQYLTIYAESRIAFFNKYGFPTLQPTEKDFGLNPEHWKLDWSKCQTKHSVYSLYNFTNRSFLADRVCFEKGSVFVFEKTGNTNIELTQFEKGIGEYLNEGFGQIIVNPHFLNFKENAESTIKVKKITQQKTYSYIVENDTSDNTVLKWIENQAKQLNTLEQIRNNILEFKKNNKSKFKRITSSQWGQVRALATVAQNFAQLQSLLFDETTDTNQKHKKGFLVHGTSANAWKSCYKDLKTELEKNKEFGTEYAIALSATMQKEAKTNEGGNQ